MKKAIFALLFAALVIFTASCKDDPDIKDTYNPSEGGIAGEIMITTPEYTLTEVSNGFAVYKSSDKSLVDIYNDHRELGYFSDNGILKNHILVKLTENSTYKVAALSANGYKVLDEEFPTYAFHGDYIVLYDTVYDGNLSKVGHSYGKVASVEPLERGGTISFAPNADSGVVYSYSHLGSVNEPTENIVENIGSQSDVYGINNAVEFIMTYDGKYESYLKTSAGCYKLPLPDSVNNHIISVICKNTDSAYILYTTDGQNMRVLELTPITESDCANYYESVDAPTVVRPSYFGGYDQYIVGEYDLDLSLQNVSWLVGANSMFHGFGGALNVVCDGNYLLLGGEDKTFYLFDKKLNVTATLSDAAILPDGTVIARPSGVADEVVVYGKKGEIAAYETYEEVFLVGGFGAAVASGDKVQFVSPTGKVLATVPEYDSELELIPERSGIFDAEGAYHVVFMDPQRRNKEGVLLNFDFWYEPSTGRSGLDVYSN